MKIDIDKSGEIGINKNFYFTDNIKRENNLSIIDNSNNSKSKKKDNSSCSYKSQVNLSKESKTSNKKRKSNDIKSKNEIQKDNQLDKSKSEEEDKYTDEKFKTSRKRVFELLKDKKRFLIGAGISAGLNGAVWPMYGVLLAQAIGTLSQKDIEKVHSGGIMVALFFFTLAFCASIVLWMQNYFFYGIGEILNKEFRVKLFNKFLNLHVGFFENKLNNPLSILARLSSYTSKIGGVATNIVGQMIQTSVTLIMGLTLAFVYDWRLSLINLVFMPIIMGTYILQFKVQKGSTASSMELESEASSVLGETLSNTKTIYAYNMQEFVVDFYSKVIYKINFQDIYKSNLINGFLYSLSQFIIFAMYGTLFYAGGVLFEEGDENYLTNMMTAILTILFSALGVGIAQAFVGDYSAAQKGIVGLFDFLDEKSLIDVEESEKNGISSKEFKGKIEFKNVNFHYFNTEQLIFNDLSFVVQPGQSVAFVGPSGSGKSTIISLIERFYDVNEGQILIDDVDIKEYNLVFLRKKIGTVLQEPGIFSRPIRENIRYGKLESNNDEVESVAKKAFIDNNLHNLSSLGSGGEMQRVAIARAILKNPGILLLDEATSALDANLEEHIKHSLKELMKNRTSIAVAHRLTTIINCDVIFYLENGRIFEQGSHDELMKKNGKYAMLYNQSIE